MHVRMVQLSCKVTSIHITCGQRHTYEHTHCLLQVCTPLPSDWLSVLWKLKLLILLHGARYFSDDRDRFEHMLEVGSTWLPNLGRLILAHAVPSPRSHCYNNGEMT